MSGMVDAVGAPTGAEDYPERVLGRIEAPRPGPTLVCVAGLHGNEPAGVHALRRVFRALQDRRPELRGTFLGLTGNRRALASGRRFIDADLNRCWTRDRVEAWDAGRRAPSPTRAEDAEAAGILGELKRAFTGRTGEVYVLDLHTTSGHSPPFATIGDTLRNRRFALSFPVPIILGLEEHLDGTMLEYVNSRGYITMGFEAGQHDDPDSVDRAEECVWLALARAGLLVHPEQTSEVAHARQHLTAVSRTYPRVLEVRYRHALDGDDPFRMEPGYSSFQPVTRGQLLGIDRNGAVSAVESGRILLPLYQTQGEDGFFLMREFRPFWLSLSAAVRRLRLDAALHWLPGVHRDPVQRDTLVIDRRVARWFALQVFHLLGYRRWRLEGDTLVMKRRRDA